MFISLFKPLVKHNLKPFIIYVLKLITDALESIPIYNVMLEDAYNSEKCSCTDCISWNYQWSPTHPLFDKSHSFQYFIFAEIFSHGSNRIPPFACLAQAKSERSSCFHQSSITGSPLKTVSIFNFQNRVIFIVDHIPIRSDRSLLLGSQTSKWSFWDVVPHENNSI